MRRRGRWKKLKMENGKDAIHELVEPSGVSGSIVNWIAKLASILTSSVKSSALANEIMFGCHPLVLLIVCY